MINIPPISSVESALDTYYKYPQLGNKEIRLVFGQIGSAKVCELKKLAREKMFEQGQLLLNDKMVNTDAAFTAWGIDVADLEKRLSKLKRMERNNGKVYSRSEEAV